ncbi:MAG: hypothetical protein H0V35_15130 [Nitrospira sp.]|nr:hypothetical protein [Nitrospira sp.]
MTTPARDATILNESTTRYDVTERGSGNEGHLYGTVLLEKDKDTLVEYLKML